jgi:endonuclease/exonuclease/phosphatase family metal-dependent hydrolase
MAHAVKLVATLAALLWASSIAAQTRLSVMSFNTWGGGLNNGELKEGQGLAQTVAAIRAAGADLVGLQEVRAESRPCTTSYCPPQGPSVTAEVARQLGFYYLEQTPVENPDIPTAVPGEALWANAILSRYPILGPTPLGLGARIEVDGHMVYLFNIHPTDYPYQPYQVLGIEYGAAPYVASSEQAVRYARRTRAVALNALLRDIAAAVTAGLQPMTVPWPLTQALEANGFTDAWRTVYPDVVARPGFTWSPLITDATPSDHRDRIDFVFVRGAAAVIEGAAVVGEETARADIVVSPWPSDHRAVVARLSIGNQGTPPAGSISKAQFN